MKFKFFQVLTLSVIVFSLFVGLVESITYYGFFAKHFFLSSHVIYITSIFMTLFHRQSLPKNHQSQKIMQYISISAIFSLVIFNVIEALTFPNFIFANIHLNLLSYPIFVLFLVGLYTVYVAKETSNIQALSRAILFIGIGLYLHMNVPKVITGVYKGINEIVSNPFATYDEKMEKSYGDFYLAMKMVQELTPEDAVLAIPPQENPWLTEGNGALVRYFIYPRQLTHIEQSEFDIEPTHYLIAKGSWNSDDISKYYWPKEKISAKRVWELRDREYIEYNKDYDPETDKWNWGLIEVKK